MKLNILVGTGIARVSGFSSFRYVEMEAVRMDNAVKVSVHKNGSIYVSKG